MGRRLLDANFLTYDDLLVRLDAALGRPQRGLVACARLHHRYRVVLVDEFQDTDAVQWGVVHKAFAGGRRPPDPAGAGGRPQTSRLRLSGADVYSYLDAARTAGADRHFTLEVNWRSDADSWRLTQRAVFDPARLGHREIIYRRVRATPPPHRRGPGRTRGSAPARPPGGARRPQLGRTSRRLVQKDSAQRWIAADLAGDIVSLLSSGAELVEWVQMSAAGAPRPSRPGDIGVLVRTNRQAVVVQAALRGAGVPVVVAGAQSVLSTLAAHDWLRLLEALEQPATRSRAVAAALTPFVGMSAQQLVAADEDTWEALHSRLYLWATVCGARAWPPCSLTSTRPRPCPRLLAEIDGERRLTDLGHVAELLHAEAVRSGLGLAALRTWLSRRTEEVGSEGADADLRSRRLDSGAEAVHVLTVHRAKGLEFPIVYCPYLWDGAPAERFGAPVLFHDAEDHERRKLDVGGDSGDPVYRRHFDAGQEDSQGEDFRHLYVALTRARHQAVVWWVAVQGCQHSALGRLLLAKGPDGDVAVRGRPGEPKDSEVRARFESVAGAVPGLVSVETAALGGAGPWTGAGQPSPRAELQAATFARHLDLRWQRSSYSSLTASAHGAPFFPAGVVSSEPETPGTTDEPPGPVAGDIRLPVPPGRVRPG